MLGLSVAGQYDARVGCHDEKLWSGCFRFEYTPTYVILVHITTCCFGLVFDLPTTTSLSYSSSCSFPPSLLLPFPSSDTHCDLAKVHILSLHTVLVIFHGGIKMSAILPAKLHTFSWACVQLTSAVSAAENAAEICDSHFCAKAPSLLEQTLDLKALP